MLKKLSWILLILAICLSLGAGWYLSRTIFRFEQQKEETAEIILMQMKAVSKLVTAEGYFSEVYDYKDYYKWDIVPLRKKALMRVKAKVIMGYDLEQLDFSIDNADRVITISDPSAPQILALEHDVDYYDLTSGTFNRFTEKDFNALNDRARNFISETAMQSDLVDLANSRKDEIFNTLHAIAATAGYSIQIKQSSTGHIGQNALN